MSTMLTPSILGYNQLFFMSNYIITLELTEQIAKYLESRIIHLELKPDEPLYEIKLDGEMGVFHPPPPLSIAVTTYAV